MHLPVICPNCVRPFEIDDADYSSTTCPNCGWEWICNVDAEPDEASLTEYEFPDTTPLSVQEMESSAGNDDWQRTASRPKPRRRESSLASKILPPILGGLTAVPIALAILWYGFGRDLGNAGPTIAKYVPWIVPESLRGTSRRFPRPERPTDTTPRPDRDFGVMGSKSEPFSDLPVTDPIPVPLEIPRVEPSVDAGTAAPTAEPTAELPAEPMADPVAEQIRQHVQTIHSLHDHWESEPTQPWSQVAWAIHRETTHIAELYSETENPRGATAPSTPDSLLDLIREPWYLEALEQSAAKTLSETHPPEAFDYIVWPVQFIAPSSHDSTRHDPIATVCDVAPSLTIGSRSVYWIANESVASQIRDTTQPSTAGQRLVLGQVERVDERGYFIRIEAILAP